MELEDFIVDDEPHKKKKRKGKRRVIDPTYKPPRDESDYDSGSPYSSDSSTPVRRQNPRRNATASHDGSRINYSAVSTSESARKRNNGVAPTSTGNNRKRQRTKTDSTSSTTTTFPKASNTSTSNRNSVNNNTNNNNHLFNSNDAFSDVTDISPKPPVDNIGTPMSDAGTRDDTNTPLPPQPPPSQDGGVMASTETSKTSSFFSRVLQGMKNFWIRGDTNPPATNTPPATTTSTGTNTTPFITSTTLKSNEKGNSTAPSSSVQANSSSSSSKLSNGSKRNQKRKIGSSSNSSKETEAYHSSEDAKPSGKRSRTYYYNEDWHIPSEELQMCETISSGTFGDVARAVWRGSDVAVKTIRTPSPNVGDKVLNLFLKEVSILSKLRHPSIVLFMGASITPKLSIIMEYHSKGSLYDLLHVQKETLGYAQVIQMAKEIAEGLNYLHLCSPKIIHRDVKSSNILVTTSRSVKIADFGISKETAAGSDSTMTGFMGTSSYMSPEMIRGVRYTEKVDIYSFGILLWELYSHRVPFKSLHGIQVAHRVMQGERPPIADTCPPAFKISLILFHSPHNSVDFCKHF